MNEPVRIVSYRDARREIRAADLGLVRATSFSPTSSAIGAFGRSDYSHALFLDFWDFVPMVLESREWVGSRAVTLKSQVQRYPGAIHVYRPRLSDDQAEACAVKARQMLGQPYDYQAILAMWLLRVPGYRMAFRADTRDGGETIEGAKHCSRFYSAAIELGCGEDPVPHLAGKFTEPGDLARSAFFRPLFALVP